MNSKLPEAPCYWNNSEAAAWQSGYEAGRDSIANEHAALVAVAEAAKALQYECGKLSFMSHNEQPELYAAWSEMTNALNNLPRRLN